MRLLSLRLAGAASVLLMASARLVSSQPSAPILATEDTLRTYTLPETTRVRARRVPLAEIIRRARDGERRKYAGISTLAYDRSVKVTLEFGGSKPHRECIESATRVYYRDPDRWAEVPLRKSHYEIDANGGRKPKQGDEDDDSDSGDREARSLSRLPPYLEHIEKYRFEIVNRSVRPGQILYEIAFEPRSDFDMLPGGHMWILTDRYQIVREELHLNRLPFPWALKSLGLLTREWQLVEGHWVEKRFTVHADLRAVIAQIPHSVEVVVQFDHFRFDPPLDDAIFEASRP